MQKNIFRAALLLTLLTALLVGVMAAGASYSLSEAQLKGQLWQELSLLSSLEEEKGDGAAFIKSLGSLSLQNRLTWIAQDGTVLFDSQSRADTMQNHLARQEVAEAEENGTGYAKRFSDTLLEEQLYCARKLGDGTYLRLAATQRTIAGHFKQLSLVLLLGIAVTVTLAGVPAHGRAGWSGPSTKSIWKTR